MAAAVKPIPSGFGTHRPRFSHAPGVSRHIRTVLISPLHLPADSCRLPSYLFRRKNGARRFEAHRLSPRVAPACPAGDGRNSPHLQRKMQAPAATRREILRLGAGADLRPPHLEFSVQVLRNFTDRRMQQCVAPGLAGACFLADQP